MGATRNDGLGSGVIDEYGVRQAIQLPSENPP